MIECFKKIFSKVFVCSALQCDFYVDMCTRELITVKRENKYFMGKA
mgnify:CR=1 FL=1